MAVKKKPAKKQASANNKPKQSQTPAKPVAVEDITPDAMEAAVIAQLVSGGMPYAEAQASVLGGAKEPAVDESYEDVDDIPVAPQKSKDFSKAQVELAAMLDDIEDAGDYEVTATLPSHIMEWVIRRTLQEAFVRNNPNFLVEDYLLLMLKEQRAIDPTKGGKVHSSSSGPKDLYNPNTGQWS